MIFIALKLFFSRVFLVAAGVFVVVFVGILSAAVLCRGRGRLNVHGDNFHIQIRIGLAL